MVKRSSGKNFEELEIELAYRKLKTFVYYDKTDLRLRERLAEFECSTNFQAKLDRFRTIVSSATPVESPEFQTWLSEIKARIVPKSVNHRYSEDAIEKTDMGETPGPPEDSCGTFITNVTSCVELNIPNVNYFFDGPIELHLLSVLWVVEEGKYLDAALGDDCYGNRLEEHADHIPKLFRRYQDVYSAWRDNGIKKARQLLDDNTSVCILGLDIQQYYYRIRIDYASVAASVRAYRSGVRADANSTDARPGKLLRCVKAINLQFQENIADLLNVTHADPAASQIDSKDEIEYPSSIEYGLPIGLSSSSVLANWYLKDFDSDIRDLIRPAYYGRYVDDILLVVESPQDPGAIARVEAVEPVKSFITHLLVRNGILRDSTEGRYEIINPRGLFLQSHKCILQHFDARHSHAGLNKFVTKLEENGSQFLLLPVDDADSPLEDVGYDLLYEGSVNKFRSIKQISENSLGVARYLVNQSIIHLLTDDPVDKKISADLLKFFKGKNAIEFNAMWERVLTYYAICGDAKSSVDFKTQMALEIDKVTYRENDTIQDDLRSNLVRHLELSDAMAQALLIDQDSLPEGANQATLAFRKANLLRHNFVKVPLINYTNYAGPLRLSNEAVIPSDTLPTIDQNRLKYSPRYINFDELVLLAQSGHMDTEGKPTFEFASYYYSVSNNTRSPNVIVTPVDDYDECNIGGNQPDLHKSIQVALVNIPVSPGHIEASYLKCPDLSRARLKTLSLLLNDISRYRTGGRTKIDLVVFPEVSIPHAWTSMVVGWVRKHGIGVICGLEHRVNAEGEALNELLAALPYKDDKNRTVCVPLRRLKKWYSPNEKFVLENEFLKLPDSKTVRYQLFRWRGASFAIYNCYELADITDRSLFKSKVDFIVATEYNRDVNYFSNIIESAALDLHCYMIQVNDSQWGDSRIVRPSSSELKNPLCVKGGDNRAFLTARLGLESLRTFQRKDYGLQKDCKEFKPTPPGFERSHVHVRIKMGKKPKS